VYMGYDELTTRTLFVHTTLHASAAFIPVYGGVTRLIPLLRHDRGAMHIAFDLRNPNDNLLLQKPLAIFQYILRHYCYAYMGISCEENAMQSPHNNQRSCMQHVLIHAQTILYAAVIIQIQPMPRDASLLTQWSPPS
jgi:hypothetical protein